jgi:hypothetical protein
LLSQDAPILDAALLSGGTPEHLIVLEPERVVLYRNENGHWQHEQTFPVVHTRAWPRDLRGRVVLDPEHLFEAYLPGVICSGALTSTLSMNCHEADDPWPLGNRPFSLHAFFSPARNFFTGVVVPGIGVQNTFKPFYAAAPLPRESYVLWLLASVDGSSHLVDGTNDLLMERINGGSDLVSVKSSCGSGWQVLASSKGDRSAGDALRAYEIADRQPVPAGEPLNFAGLITALWSKEDGSSAIAVERNLETGNYDAFSLAIFCSQ